MSRMITSRLRIHMFEIKLGMTHCFLCNHFIPWKQYSDFIFPLKKHAWESEREPRDGQFESDQRSHADLWHSSSLEFPLQVTRLCSLIFSTNHHFMIGIMKALLCYQARVNVSVKYQENHWYAFVTIHCLRGM